MLQNSKQIQTDIANLLLHNAGLHRNLLLFGISLRREQHYNILKTNLSGKWVLLDLSEVCEPYIVQVKSCKQKSA